MTKIRLTKALAVLSSIATALTSADLVWPK